MLSRDLRSRSPDPPGASSRPAFCRLAAWVDAEVGKVKVWGDSRLHGIKKNGIMPFATAWMDLEIIMLSEVSQTEKDKYHDNTYIWNLKK